MNILEQKERANLLLDCYQSLLTSKQQMMMQLYYQEDLSLSEIADEFNVSRNAVHDLLSRSLHILEEYEDKLHLLKKHEQRLELIDKIEKSDQEDHETLKMYLDRIKDL